MLLTETDFQERIESPLNLLNRLKNGMIPRSSRRISDIPSMPSASDLIDGLDEKVAFGSIKSKAAGVMSKALEELSNKLSEVTKPKELAQIADSMGKIIANTSIKRDEDVNNGPTIIVYAPQVMPLEAFNIIDIQGKEEEK